MEGESQRSEPRVDYPAEVRLSSPALRQPARGRALNLSSSGIFVETDAACAVGTTVVCDLPLPGGRRRLKGRVTRTQPLPRASVGLGISFLDLDERDEAVLRALVDERDGGGHHRLVKVRFEGLAEPLRSQAIVTKEGIRLSTALPFLRLSSPVEVAFIAGESRVSSHGIVRGVQIERRGPDGVPRLAIDVALPGDGGEAAPDQDGEPEGSHLEQTQRPVRLFAARRTEGTAAAHRTPGAPPRAVPAPRRRILGRQVWARRTAPEPPAARSFEPSPVAAAPRFPPGEGRTAARAVPPEVQTGELPAVSVGAGEDPARAAEGRSGRWFFVAVPAALVVFAAGLLGAHLRVAAVEHELRSAPVPSPAGPAPEPPATPAVAAPAGDPAASIAPPEGKATAVPAPDPAGGAGTSDLERAPDPAAIGSEAAPASGGATLPNAPTAGPAEAAAARVPGPAAATAASTPPAPSAPKPNPFHPTRPLPPDAPGPTVTLDGDRATALVPLLGSTDGMIQQTLFQPPGLSVTLPHARAAIAPGIHRIGHAGFRAVWIRERVAGGIQVRFLFDDPAPHARLLDVDRDAVEVRVKLDQPIEPATR